MAPDSTGRSGTWCLRADFRRLAAVSALALVAMAGLAVASGAAVPGEPDDAACETPGSAEDLERVRPPKKKRGVAALSPEDLAEHGPVVVEAVLSCRGEIRRIRIETELPERVEQTLRKNLARWRYRPAELDGEPVAIPYRLVLSDRPPR